MGLAIRKKETRGKKILAKVRRLLEEEGSRDMQERLAKILVEVEAYHADVQKTELCDKAKSRISLKDSRRLTDGYTECMGECLSLAAQQDAEELFDVLLSKTDCAVEIDFRSAQKYQDKLAEKFGSQSISGVLWDGCHVPEIYAAVLYGDRERMAYDFAHGVLPGEDHTEKFLLFGSPVGMTECFEIVEKVWAIMGEAEGVERSLLETVHCHDLFTAAVLSENQETVRYLAGLLGEIPWSRGLEEGILYAKKEFQDFMLREFPEIQNYLSLSAIVRARSMRFLEILMDRQKNRTDYWEELEDWIHTGRGWLDGMSVEELSRKKEKLKEEKRFLDKLLCLAPEQKYRAAIQDMLWQEALSVEYDEDKCRMLLQTFFEIGDVSGRDFTGFAVQCISGHPRILEVLQSVPGFTRIGINLDAKELDQKEIFEEPWTRKELHRVMEVFVPLYAGMELDRIVCNVLAQNRLSDIRKAVQCGYLTRKNALKAYERMTEQRDVKEEILTVLIALAQKMEMEERYEGN